MLHYQNPSSIDASLKRKHSIPYEKTNDQCLTNFCRQQIEALSRHDLINFVQVTFFDPLLKTYQVFTHPSITIDSFSTAPLFEFYPSIQLQIKENLSLFKVTKISAPMIGSYVYCCKFGYTGNTIDYLTVVAHQPISESLQDEIIHYSSTLVQYLDLYKLLLNQRDEIRLLESIYHKIAHQLRNPLSIIALYAQNLSLGLQGQSEKQQALTIFESVQTLLTSLGDLVSCGKGSQLKLRPLDLKELVTEVIQELHSALDEKQLVVYTSAESTILTLDRVQFKQVIINLLNNAIHFSPRESSIKVQWEIYNGEILLHVSDHGPGIHSDHLTQIFQPFFTCREGGTGLGLSIAQKIILDHHGSIWAHNNHVNGGAIISISLSRQLGASLNV